MQYTAILVDDEELVLNRLALGFEWENTNFEVIATYTDSLEALEQIALLKPDVVLTDIKMPKLSGLELMEKVSQISPSTQFIVLSGHEEFSYVRKSMSLGACDYCVKPIDDDDIEKALKKIETNLINKRNYIETIVTRAFENNSETEFEAILSETLKQNNYAFPVIIAASIGDLSPYLKGHTAYINFFNYNNIYIYILQNDKYLKNAGFQQNILRCLKSKEIENFLYLQINNDEPCLETTKILLNKLFANFLGQAKQNTSFKIDATVDNIENSTYLELLTKYFVESKPTYFLDTLTNYEYLYPAENRNIEECVKIYNLSKRLSYKQNNILFNKDVKTGQELTNLFISFDDMITLLTFELSEKILGVKNIDIQKIKNESLKKVVEYVYANYSKEINFQEACVNFNINPSYLSQVFQKELGTTFTSFLTQLRIEHAKNLLVTTNLPISIISEQVGFNQFYYFSKVFKKITDCTPSSYRENYKK